MEQYGYRASGKQEERTVYRQEELRGMTTFHLREICQKEKLVVPMASRLDREELIRFIMRYRGLREHMQIKDFVDGGLEALQGLVNKLELLPDNHSSITVPSHLILYEGEGIELTDHYEVSSSNVDLYEGNVLLVDEQYHVYTCFYLQKIKDRGVFLRKGKDVPIIRAEGHQFSILYFKREDVSEILYEIYHGRQISIPRQASCIQIPLLAVDIRQTEETSLPLIIDFGSSNTTLGMYCQDGTSEIVKTADINGKEYRESTLIPSIIGIKGIKEGQPVYCFGYEAKALAGKSYQDEDSPLFYDIKRWVSAPDRKQQVITTGGVKLELKRTQMLEAYMRYLIGLAEQQFKLKFKNIQLLAPVRQTERFAGIFREILPDMNVECSLDEGMAVLFDSIHELIQSQRYIEGVWYQALIMDCGGGTTDLTSGKFRIQNNRVSYEVDLETGYENGNTNFGGNNLTFRILQLIKIRLLETTGYPQFHFDLESFTGGESRIYETLERLYEDAEHILPTRFSEYEQKSREEYFGVKNNYYHLFRVAEAVKESFFQRHFRYELKLGTEGLLKEDEGILIDKWRLSIKEKGRICPLRKEIIFSFYLYEIENLLRPDIYGLMTQFLERPFVSGELSEYGMLKLTGQSCKSHLFTEGLKEFVPGRLIRNERGEDNGSELKMCCLQGAVNYFKNCKLGYMKINQGSRVNALPYAVMAYTHENKEKILIQSLQKEQDIGYISRFKIGEQLDLYLRDEKGNKLKVFHFPYHLSQFTKVTQEEINERYKGTVIQEETDTILEGEIKFFVWASKEKWGFLILPILRENDLLRQGEETFFAFEDDTWEENFFDGRK
ncbi:MAG: hypothetical protein ACI4DQ_02155 [Lachnospiraceae bacterium]